MIDNQHQLITFCLSALEYEVWGPCLSLTVPSGYLVPN